MPKNKGKGGKNRRRGKNESEQKREIALKENGQEYGQVVRMLGNGRLEAFCFDGKKRLAHIRGKMRKRVWVNQGDIVLLGLREYQDDKADVLLKYHPDEARILQKRGLLPKDIIVEDNEGEQKNDDDLGFEFTDRGLDSESSGDMEVGSQPAARLRALPAYSDSFSDSDDSDDSVDLDKL
eukprot:TRINITY_DN16765_c0_g1_i1.p1 TRINITY_DN16765_c0_g1~~TRINITY_DN16765_c0_g1_i1.p1  ORF type:complete len:180 (-),score=51.56 TRINITY_DN16765_c0_g1_i1:93-632(-)